MQSPVLAYAFLEQLFSRGERFLGTDLIEVLSGCTRMRGKKDLGQRGTDERKHWDERLRQRARDTTICNQVTQLCHSVLQICPLFHSILLLLRANSSHTTIKYLFV